MPQFWLILMKKDLNACLPGLAIEGNDIGLAHRVRIDALRLLKLAERLDAIPERCRPLELEALACGGHLVRERLLDRMTLAGQELPRVRNLLSVLRLRDAANARRRTARDLVLQARAGA